MTALRDALTGWFSGARLLIVLVFLSGVGASAVMLSNALVADDDHLWLAMGTWKIADRAAGDALEQRVIDTLAGRGLDGTPVVRFEQRRDYFVNYAAALALWRTVGSFVPATSDKGEAFALALRMTVMFAGGMAVMWLVMCLLLNFVRDPDVITGLVFGLVVNALFAVTVGGPNNFFLGLNRSVAELAPYIVRYLIQAPPSLGLFGFSGRNLWVILFVAAIALRWGGRPVLSAVVYAVSFLFHASMATLLLPFVLAADLLGQPRILLRPLYVAPLAVGLLYGLSVESLWRTTISTASVLLVLGVVVLGALAALAVFLAVRRGAGGLDRVPVVGPVLGRLAPVARWGAERRDLTVFAALWAATLIPAVVIGKLSDPVSANYFWLQIHARSLAALQPVLVAGLAVIAVRRYGVDRSGIAMLVVAAIAVLALGIQANDRRGHPVNTLVPRIEWLQGFIAGTEVEADRSERAVRRIEEAMAGTGPVPREDAIYLALERSLATGEDRLTPALAAALGALPLER